MPASLQQVISDETKMYCLKSDGTFWVCDTVPPLSWYRLPAYTGTGRPANLCLSVINPDKGGKNLYCVASDGTLWLLDNDGIWYRENNP